MDPSLAVGENVYSRRGLYCLAAKKTKFRQPTTKEYNRNFGAEAGIGVVPSFDVSFAPSSLQTQKINF